jgi:hypothetical protein
MRQGKLLSQSGRVTPYRRGRVALSVASASVSRPFGKRRHVMSGHAALCRHRCHFPSSPRRPVWTLSPAISDIASGWAFGPGGCVTPCRHGRVIWRACQFRSRAQSDRSPRLVGPCRAASTSMSGRRTRAGQHGHFVDPGPKPCRGKRSAPWDHVTPCRHGRHASSGASGSKSRPV